jgi:hypothetical protein
MIIGVGIQKKYRSNDTTNINTDTNIIADILLEYWRYNTSKHAMARCDMFQNCV